MIPILTLKKYIDIEINAIILIRQKIWQQQCLDITLKCRQSKHSSDLGDASSPLPLPNTGTFGKAICAWHVTNIVSCYPSHNLITPRLLPWLRHVNDNENRVPKAWKIKTIIWSEALAALPNTGNIVSGHVDMCPTLFCVTHLKPNFALRKLPWILVRHIIMNIMYPVTKVWKNKAFTTKLTGNTVSGHVRHVS